MQRCCAPVSDCKTYGAFRRGTIRSVCVHGTVFAGEVSVDEMLDGAWRLFMHICTSSAICAQALLISVQFRLCLGSGWAPNLAV
jgi:hypothetical protein